MEKLRADPIPERMNFLESLASCHLRASSQEPYGALSWRVFKERRMTFFRCTSILGLTDQLFAFPNRITLFREGAGTFKLVLGAVKSFN